MKNNYLNDLLEGLKQENKNIKEESEKDVKDYLDSSDDSEKDFLSKKQYGKVFKKNLSSIRGRTGFNQYYEIDFYALKDVLEKITKKTFTLTQVENIVSAVRLALGVGAEEEKEDFIEEE